MLYRVSPSNKFFIPPHKNSNFQYTSDDLWNNFCIKTALEVLPQYPHLTLLPIPITCLDFYTHLAKKRMEFAKQYSAQHYNIHEHEVFGVKSTEKLDDLIERYIVNKPPFFEISVNCFGLMRLGPMVNQIAMVHDGIGTPYWNYNISTKITKTSEPYYYYWNVLSQNIQNLPHRNFEYKHKIGDIDLTYLDFETDSIIISHTSSKNLQQLFDQYIEPLFAYIVNRNNLVTLANFADLTWLLAQATPCMRGSAAITQMVLFALMLYRDLEPLAYQSNMIDLDALTLLMEQFRIIFEQRILLR